MNNNLFSDTLNEQLAVVDSLMVQKLTLSNYKLRDNYLNLLSAGGKRIRPAFVLYSGLAFGGNRERLLALASSVELVHMSTLIHDDIIDQATTRRGKETLNILHGDPWALYAGNYLFAESLEIASPSDDTAITKLMAEASVKIVEGELLQQLALFDTSQTLRSYLKRIRGKTALLLALSCQIGAMATTENQQQIRIMQQFGYNLGMAFQIIDDILDMEEESELNKTKGQDLYQGHINLPAIFVLQKHNNDSKKLAALIKRRFSDSGDLQNALNVIKGSGAAEDAKKIALRYSEKAKKSLDFINNQTIKKELLRISDSLFERNY